MKYVHFYFKSFFLFICGILIAVSVSQNHFLHSFLFDVGAYGYLGAFIAGILFSSTFTVATAVVILFALAQRLSPVEISIVAGLGATLGNYIIFLFINHHIVKHIHAFRKQKTKQYHKRMHGYAHWFIPFLGLVILASPFPDEIGIFLLSLYKMKTKQFLLVSFILKFVGILIVVSAVHYLF